MNYSNYSESRFFCTNCGHENIIVFRKRGQRRGAGHLKKLYCIYCKKECNCAEVSYKNNYTYDNFNEEFKLGRFVDGERIAIKDLRSCKYNCPYNKNGKCWNANNSYNCGKK